MKYCSACKTKYRNSFKYCKNCGKKLAKKNKQNFFSGNKIKIVLLVVGIFLLLFLFGAITRIPYTGMVTYSYKTPITYVEEYNVKEPYYVQECHQANRTYTAEWGKIERPCLEQKCIGRYSICVNANEHGVCSQYEHLCKGYNCLRYRVDCKLEIKNTEDQRGFFKFKAYVINQNGVKIHIKNITINASANGRTNAVWNYNHSSGDYHTCWYNDFQASNKTVCTNITKYKTVVKERLVSVEQEVYQKTVQQKRLFQSLE